MNGPIPPKPSTVRKRAMSRRRRKKNRLTGMYDNRTGPKPWLARQLKGG